MRQAIMKHLDWRASLLSTVQVLAAIGGLGGFGFGSPMRASEVIPTLLVLCLPVGLGLARPLYQLVMATPSRAAGSRRRGVGRVAARVVDGDRREAPARSREDANVLLTAICLALLGAGGILGLNRRLDHRPAAPKTVTISGKIIETRGSLWWTRRGKCSLEFPTLAPSFLPYGFDGNDAVRVSNVACDGAVVGETVLTIAAHEGAFGIPWYETDGGRSIEREIRARGDLRYLPKGWVRVE